jgi:hypothetical protein
MHVSPKHNGHRFFFFSPSALSPEVAAITVFHVRISPPIYFAFFSATCLHHILICLTVPTVFETNILKLLSPIFTIPSFTLFIYIQSPTYNYLCPTHFQTNSLQSLSLFSTAFFFTLFIYIQLIVYIDGCCILLHPVHLYTIIIVYINGCRQSTPCRGSFVCTKNCTVTSHCTASKFHPTTEGLVVVIAKSRDVAFASPALGG